jgi:starvation-inducible outer membrane lipoprotein
MIRVLILSLFLAGCATDGVTMGDPIPTPDAEIVQCQNQPELPWCQS